MKKHAAIFNGIGGFQLAAHWMGWENTMSCEIDTFCNQVTKYHFPDCIQHTDVRTTDFTIYRGHIDILTGGFPCQSFSVAGQRKGTADHRNLWPEMLRSVREIQPRWIIGENVPGLINWSKGMVFHQVQADLEAEGYQVWPVVLPACGVDAPHRRERLWFIAYADSIRFCSDSQSAEIIHSGQRGQTFDNIDGIGIERIITDTISKGSQRNEYQKLSGQGRENKRRTVTQLYQAPDWAAWPTQSPILNGNDGVPGQLADISFSEWKKKSLSAAGNAIAPKVALQLFRAIEQFESLC